MELLSFKQLAGLRFVFAAFGWFFFAIIAVASAPEGKIRGYSEAEDKIRMLTPQIVTQFPMISPLPLLYTSDCKMTGNLTTDECIVIFTQISGVD